MKILMSAYAAEPGKGSEEGKGWNFPLNIAKLGHEVWVLTSPYTSNYSDNRTKIEQALNENSALNLKFIYVDLEFPWSWAISRKEGRISGHFSTYLHYLLWQNSAYHVAKKLDQANDFDIIHHVNYGSMVLGSELWRLNKPFIFGPVGGGQTAPAEFKEFFVNQWNAEQRRTLLVKNFAKFIATRTVKKANLVLVENTETLDLLNQLGGTRRTELALSCGLPPEYFPSSFPDRPVSLCLKLLWVARLFPRKGLLLTLQALASVKSTVFFTLTILGDGPLEPYIHGWLREFNLEDRVNYCGHVSWMEVKNEYLKNDVFLFSSLRDTFGSQLLEAMAHGLPIITLDHHGARDFLPETVAIKVPVSKPPETVKMMAQAVEYMFENPQKRIEMGKAGFAFVKQYSWAEKAKRMLLLYEQVACSIS